jgi:deoxyribonuclease-4
MMILGCHVNFTNEQLLGSAKQAISYGANAFMFYTGAPQNTVRKDLDINLKNEAIKLMEENNIKIENVICHAPYIINLANNKNQEKWNFSISFLKQELERCKVLEVKYIVVHPGNALDLDINAALKNIADALNYIILDDGPMILLETMAGKGSECGKTLEELKTIIDNVNSNNIGICLDTCHLNDAGYEIGDFDELLKQVDDLIGLDKVHCIHLNDSKNALNSHKDRHENIGLGTIGFSKLLYVLNHNKLEDVPKILETPYILKQYPPYKFEIESLKNQQINNNLIDDIISYYK